MSAPITCDHGIRGISNCPPCKREYYRTLMDSRRRKHGKRKYMSMRYRVIGLEKELAALKQTVETLRAREVGHAYAQGER